MKATILGGVLALAPLVIVVIILAKAFEISLRVAEPINRIIKLDTALGVVAVNLIALLLIVGFCYLAGVLAQKAFLSGRMQKLEGLLIDLIPGYAAFRVVVGSMSSKENMEDRMKPVLVRFDDYDQIAFEIEKGKGQSVLFLPGTPSAWSGSSAVVDQERVTYLNVPAHQAVKLMRIFGRGSIDMRAQALAAPADRETG